MPYALILLATLLVDPIDLPRVMDDRLQLELVCENPDVVHPIGLTIDAKGRLLVIESHTHFPPKDYAGPPHDRILLIDPKEKPAKPKVFFEGSKQTMSIARAPDDSIYVATRSEIFRLRDTDGDDKADERTRIAHLETAGNYPHNGLAGLAFPKHHGSRADELRFGFGENLGADYKLIGSDGTSLAGGGEGGNVYACRFDGSKLRRVATGFWNPFAMTFDPQGRLFAVDNDPDSRPPCRLLHVVEGGDYGFQFRHGRKGTHPFTAWNGELPGTLPMMCGTGEAPSAVLYNLSIDDRRLDSAWRGSLLVTSWGDHRIERYELTPRGKSFTGTMKPLVVGGENFRPVGMDGDLDTAVYFTDWVDKSYTLHGKGRIWRLQPKPSDDDSAAGHGGFSRTELDRRSEAERRAALQKLWRELAEKDSQDPFEWNEAAQSLSYFHRDRPALNDESLSSYFRDFTKPNSSNSQIWAAVAAREANAANVKPLVPYLLQHDDPRVRLLGVMWVGNDGLVEHRADVEQGLSRAGLTRELFECSLAALEMLDRVANPNAPPQDNKRQTSGDVFVLKVLNDPQASPSLRRFALKSLPPTHPELKLDLLTQLANDADPTMRVEAIRSLRDCPAAERGELLRIIATDANRALADRAEATIGLNVEDSADRATLESLKSSPEEAVANEAKRLLRVPSEDARPVAERIAALAASSNLASGDVAAGERLFFHSKIAACYRCHEHAGRGAGIGPALTTIARSLATHPNGREKLLQSILEPSREIGPSYVPWLIETTDGRTLIGLYIGEEIKGEHRYADPTGKVFLLHPNQIERREAAKQSIMPADLAKTLTDDELRDLIAFLLRP
jgi:putative membrane-bound dehydrogenase-like protein